jgi:hypothetical protein
MFAIYALVSDRVRFADKRLRESDNTNPQRYINSTLSDADNAVHNAFPDCSRFRFLNGG